MRATLGGVLATGILVLCACGGGGGGAAPSPTGPSAVAPPAAAGGGVEATGRVVAALEGTGVPAAELHLEAHDPVIADGDGYFRLRGAASRYRATLMRSGFVTRETQVTLSPDLLLLSLIPDGFNLTAFDEFARGSQGMLQRWTRAPRLVLIEQELDCPGVDQPQCVATPAAVDPQRSDDLLRDLGDGLSILTGSGFQAFAGVDREQPAAGSSVSMQRHGTITVARVRGLLAATGWKGYGQWAALADGAIVGGTIRLDAEYDQSGRYRRALRLHELGHALGYSHVSSAESVMNESARDEPTPFDREAARIAFQRPPGNRAPDIDPGASLAASTFAPAGGDVRWGAPLP